MKMKLLFVFFALLVVNGRAEDSISSHECSNHTADIFQTILKLALTENKAVGYKQNDVLVARCPVQELLAHLIARSNHTHAAQSIIWYKNNRRLRLINDKTSVKRRVRQHGHKLVIKRLLRMDRGVYNCRFTTNSAGLILKSPDLVLNFIGIVNFSDFCRVKNKTFKFFIIFRSNR
jgi:hypothetical protein